MPSPRPCSGRGRNTAFLSQRQRAEGGCVRGWGHGGHEACRAVGGKAGAAIIYGVSSSPKILFGFHAVGVRIKTAPQSVLEVFFDASRRDARMRQFMDRAREAGVRLIESDGLRLSKLCGGHGHQGVVARVQPVAQVTSLDELLEKLEAEGTVPLLLVLDGVTDPHNLGACLRVADGAGAHAVIAPKDHAAGINATVAKVASGAAETMPYFMVTNLARTLNELKERGIWCIGTSDDASQSLYEADLKAPVALVLGAEGEGMRQLTRKTCDQLVSIPMQGAVESLNVSVASGVCLYEALRQRRLSRPAAAP
jgi:23S rRNA (guanosine2251-2'-O)-methyltransferase